MSKSVLAQNWAGRLFSWTDGSRHSNQQTFPNPVGANLSAGGAGAFWLEDFPLTQNLVPMADHFQVASTPTSWSGDVALDANGWPAADFGFFLHQTHQTPSWTTGAFACGYISKGTGPTQTGGTEVLTAVGGTISNVTFNGTTKLCTFDFTVTVLTGFGFSVTNSGGSGGATGIFAYLPAYRANASAGHADITVANLLAGKPLFTNEAITFYKKFRSVRTMWPQNIWYCSGGLQANISTGGGAGSTSCVLATALPPGTYPNTILVPSTFNNNPDNRTVTVDVTGLNVSWTGALTLAAQAMNTQCTSTTRRTAANTKNNQRWFISNVKVWGTEGYPLEWFTTFIRAIQLAGGSTGLWCNFPVNYDTSYLTAFMTQLASDLPTGLIYIEFGNEDWNPTGRTLQPCNSLAASAGLTIHQYVVTQLHTLANAGRTQFGSDWNNRVRLLYAWQQGINPFTTINQGLSYMVAQGWTPSADIWCVSGAPYINVSPAFTTTDDIPTIQSKLLTGASFPMISSNGSADNKRIEKFIAVGRHYKLTGVYECYESGFDIALEFASVANPNFGPAVLDSGITGVFETFYQNMLDLGVQGWEHFEVGVASQTALPTPNDELDLNYDNVIAGTSPILVALTSLFTGTYTPTRNVISAPTTLDLRNALDEFQAFGGTYPTFSAQTNTSPVSQYNSGVMVNCQNARTLSGIFFTTTAAGAGFNVTVDGVLGGTLSIPNTSGVQQLVSLGTPISLPAGRHYIDFGAGSALSSGITANALEIT